ncbi:MAG: hypothetical protein KAQ98_13670 [Bacteriovoracaceae bacterium]|nr:hypothetical protein [Bacteriovoracaceae bacterium]
MIFKINKSPDRNSKSNKKRLHGGIKYYYGWTEDGALEFALVNYGTDRNRYTKAKIYSLQKDGKLELYGRGTYNKDLGEHVLFGCPDCHTINLDACKSCY